MRSKHPAARYPIVYLDAIHVKLRRAGHLESQAVYLPLGDGIVDPVAGEVREHSEHYLQALQLTRPDMIAVPRLQKKSGRAHRSPFTRVRYANK